MSLRARHLVMVFVLLTGILLLVPNGARASVIGSVAEGLEGKCWACGILTSISDAGLDLGNTMFSSLATTVRDLLGVLVGLWIVLLAARIFVPFGPDGGLGDLWNKGAKKLLLLALVLGFLQSASSFWDYVFVPVMGAGVALAGQIATAGGVNSGVCSAPAASATGVSGAKQVMKGIECPLMAVQNTFGRGIVAGIAIMVHGGQAMTGSGGGGGWFSWVPSLPSAGDIVGGLVLVICGLGVSLIYFIGLVLFPLAIVDVVLRAIVIATLSPLLIAASVFAWTRGAAETAIRGLVQAGMTLVMVAVVANLGSKAIDNVFGSKLGFPDWATLKTGLEAGNSIPVWSADYWILLGLGIILLFMMKHASSMAAEFSKASAGDSTGAATGAFATMATAMTAVGLGAKGASRLFSGGGNREKYKKGASGN